MSHSRLLSDTISLPPPFLLPPLPSVIIIRVHKIFSSEFVFFCKQSRARSVDAFCFWCCLLRMQAGMQITKDNRHPSHRHHHLNAICYLLCILYRNFLRKTSRKSRIFFSPYNITKKIYSSSSIKQTYRTTNKIASSLSFCFTYFFCILCIFFV